MLIAYYINIGDMVEFEHTIIDPKDPSIDPPKNRFEFKNRIICGPYQPIITFPRTLSGNQYRGFLSRYYNNYKWIEYSPIKDAAFCFPCRMFKGNSLNNSQLDHAFSIRGFRHWKNATTAFNNHQNSKAHNYSTISMSKFLDGNPIDVIIDENKKLELSQRECERLKNRDFFKRLIDITILLAKSGKPFRGHDESINSFNQGMFKEISKLLIKYDPIFKNHMDSSPRNALYSSNRIQNDIIMALYNYFKRKFALLLQNKKISIIADETSDVGHHQQMSIVIRYFDSILNKPVEHFVCLQRLTTVDAQSIFNSLNYVLVNKLSLNWSSVVGVCFDGAATMSGFNNGVQAKCKAKNNSIMYIHCYAHCLNLVLVDSVGRKNRVVFDFFGTVQLIFAFIESSCVRHAILEKIAKQINVKLVTLKSISNTRWDCRSEAISAIKFNYSALVKALQEICDLIRLSDVSAKARGLIFQMKSFNFIFALNMLEPIFSVILKVSTNLQSKELDLLTAVNLIKSLKLTICQYRSDDEKYEKIYYNVIKMCDENNIDIPNVKKRKISKKVDDNHDHQYFEETKKDEMKHSCFYFALDQIISGLNVRFNQESLKLIEGVGNLVNLETTNEDILYFKTLFDINVNEIKSEIKLLKNMDNTETLKGTSTKEVYMWIKWLNERDQSTIFKNVLIVLKSFVIIPVTSCSCERAFSKLSIIKTKLRSTMNQEQLDALLYIFIEQEETGNINYDEVIEEFKLLIEGNRRIIL